MLGSTRKRSDHVQPPVTPRSRPPRQRLNRRRPARTVPERGRALAQPIRVPAALHPAMSRSEIARHEASPASLSWLDVVQITELTSNIVTLARDTARRSS